MELRVRIGIVVAAGHEQDPAELTGRVADEIRLAEQPPAGLVVAGEVPAMQGVLVAQVRAEVPDDLHGNARDARGDLVRGPPVEALTASGAVRSTVARNASATCGVPGGGARHGRGRLGPDHY